jgi:glycogen debranching enzyme
MSSSSLDLQALWAIGRDSLKTLARPYGFDASERDNSDYGTLFGRDSLWTLLLLLAALAYHDGAAFRRFVLRSGERVLSALIQSQGTAVRNEIEEQPGKVVHEWWTEPTARVRDTEIPFWQGRSYSGFDETFLFVTAAKRFLEIFPDTLIRLQVLRAARRAVGWIRRHGDEDGDGLYEYRRRNPANLLNQVWKDSFDSVSWAGVRLPEQPVAWIDVQGYAYRALLDAAELETTRPSTEVQNDWLLQRARDLQTRVNEAFWIPEQRSYAMAIDARKRPMAAVSSNTGHLLWSGLPSTERASMLAARLTAEDMLTPFGLRTLSALDGQFSPFAYHRGSVWPFDNAVVAAGLLSYGLHDSATRILSGLLNAIAKFGEPVEAYAVLPTAQLLESTVSGGYALAFRRFPSINRKQAFSAAAVTYAAAVLAHGNGVELVDE